MAAARNDTDSAEPLLHNILRSNPQSADASEARKVLSRVYLRTARYTRLIENFDKWAAAYPDSTDISAERADVEVFRGLPDQVNGTRQPVTLAHEKGDDFAATALINGKQVSFLMDTGAWMSVVTLQEAKRLGLKPLRARGKIGDASGNGLEIQFFLAKEIRIGAMRFRNVSFAVLPGMQAWSTSPGSGGIFGVPLLLAMGQIHWTRDGALQLGARAPAAQSRDPNLTFIGNHLALAVNVEGRDAFGLFDTGANETDFNDNFVHLFADLIEQSGRHGTRDITGLGGTSTSDAFVLPSVALRVGDTPVSLTPAHVSLQKIGGMGGACCIGNLGRDVFAGAHEVIIDFDQMHVTLQ
jgi:clan AA aspartic protease (TIGR02281 family)